MAHISCLRRFEKFIWISVKCAHGLQRRPENMQLKAVICMKIRLDKIEKNPYDINGQDLKGDWNALIISNKIKTYFL